MLEILNNEIINFGIRINGGNSMKFTQFEYKRPELHVMKGAIRALIEQFNEAATVEVQSEIIEKINAYRKDFSTQANLVYIRASIDTTDEYYQQERDILDDM